jgi:hypothetical protein
MPRAGFKPTIPVFEWAKTVHVLDRAATVIGSWWMINHHKRELRNWKNTSETMKGITPHRSITEQPVRSQE